MAKVKPGPNQIVIANDLLTGRVVYLANDGQWISDPCSAAFAPSKEAAEFLLIKGQQAEEGRIVVGPELIAAEETGCGPQPTRNRERIRAHGPTVRADHGYQAGN